MITPHELRIRNYVLIEEDGIWKEYQVDGVCLATEEKRVEGFSQPFIKFKRGTTIIRFGDDDTEDDYLVRPIPLTVELLERLLLEKAVEKWHDTDHWFIGYHGFCIAFDGNHWYLKMNVDTPVIVCYFKHLHQLQNLFHSLTGKEITLKQKA